MARSVIVLCAVVLVGLASAGTVSADDRESVVPPQALHVLGPLVGPEATATNGEAWAPPTETVPEIDPVVEGPWNRAELQPVPGAGIRWHTGESGDDGVNLSEPGIYWFAAECVADRFSEVAVRISGADATNVWINGGALSADGETETWSGVVVRGVNRLLVRADVDGGSTIRIALETSADTTTTWRLGEALAPNRYDLARHIVSINSVVVNADGTLVARRLTRRNTTGDGTRSTVGILDAEGRTVVAAIGDGSARPVSFSPDGGHLLLKRAKAGGDELWTYELDSGAVRMVLEDEPELGIARWHPAGTHLLVASARGVAEKEADGVAPMRRRALREKLTDYVTGPHLHLVELRTGVRRRLTMPGDWVVDDATFSPGGKSVIYARTVPQTAYPWFVTEIRSIDLATTADTLMAVFPAGWEVRPKALTVSPDGSQVAFIGPPEQVVEGRAGRNILQAAVWLLDVSNGEMTKISGNSSYAFTLRGSDRLIWTDDGERLLAAVTDRTGSGIAELARDADGRWQAARLPGVGDDVAESVAIAAAGTRAAAVVSNPVRPRRLELLDLAGGSSLTLEEPNRILEDTWELAPVADASFVGPSGDTIDAWWIEPTTNYDSGKTPLVVYYYGGGTPRMRTFSFDFQFFAANGYAVLVLTPRGALGFEPSFADSHVNDWGPRSSADILAGVDVFLEAHPEIDGERIGIYGGSYGGFMTAYLLTVTDRFAAAVDLFGISNLASYWGDGAWGYTYGDVAGYGSFPWNAPEIYAGNSPLFRADKITTPLLLLHGMADGNVPAHESEQLYAALEVLDRGAELVLFPDEDHGISGTWTNRVDHRTMMLEWFDLHLRGQPEAWEYRWSRN